MIENKGSTAVRMSLINFAFILLSLACIIPFLIVISISLSDESLVAKYGYSIFPRGFSFSTYQYIFSNPKQIISSYQISIIVTLVGTFISVLIMSMVSYCLARGNFRGRRVLMFYIFFTMLFSGGLVPTYILVSQYLKMSNTIWALIVPGLINVFHIVLLRTFFQKLPPALFESAKLDGASEATIFFKIAIPLSTPALATVALLGALGRWNDWFNALLYITKESLLPLQYLLYRIMNDLQFFASNMDKLPPGMLNVALPSETARMAMCVLAAGPMMFVFPFFQKYFVKGLTVGSIKE